MLQNNILERKSNKIPVFRGFNKDQTLVGFGRPVGRSVYHFRNGLGYTALFYILLDGSETPDLYPVHFLHVDCSCFDCLLWYEGKFYGMVGNEKVKIAYHAIVQY
jgi:hypothetical protein